MTGLILLVVAAAWLVAVLGLTWAITSRISHVTLRFAAALVALVALLPLPILDELIGKRQFETLCKQYAVQHVDKEQATNRRVILVKEADEPATGTAVPIRIQPWKYQDAETGRLLISYHTLRAEGGFLIRALQISETNAPLTFHGGCAPVDQFGFKKKLNIKVIE